jgi:hypothetical protein
VSYTAMCVRCLKKPARVWSGNVLRDNQRVIAGWCGERCLNARGFSGHWLPEMGASGVCGSRKGGSR